MPLVINNCRIKLYKINEKELKKKINSEGLIQIFHHIKEIGKKLNNKILQLLLISYLYYTVVKK